MNRLYALIFLLGVAGCERDNKDSTNVSNIYHTNYECELDKIFKFQRHLGEKTQSFHILGWGSSSFGKLFVLYSDSSKEIYSSLEKNIDGKIINTWLSDLDKDNLKEIVVSTQGSGSGSYGNLYVFESDTVGALTEIKLPMLTAPLTSGYEGNDSFNITTNKVIRVYPTYHRDDSHAQPTGKNMEIQYVLKNNQLKVESIIHPD